jgi:hypothetical protein
MKPCYNKITTLVKVEVAMGHLDDEYDDGSIIDAICVGCDLFKSVNDMNLYNECFAKLERNFIHSRD